jgi:hypothetical protein
MTDASEPPASNQGASDPSPNPGHIEPVALGYATPDRQADGLMRSAQASIVAAASVWAGVPLIGLIIGRLLGSGAAITVCCVVIPLGVGVAIAGVVEGNKARNSTGATRIVATAGMVLSVLAIAAPIVGGIALLIMASLS